MAGSFRFFTVSVGVRACVCSGPRQYCGRELLLLAAAGSHAGSMRTRFMESGMAFVMAEPLSLENKNRACLFLLCVCVWILVRKWALITVNIGSALTVRGDTCPQVVASGQWAFCGQSPTICPKSQLSWCWCAEAPALLLPPDMARLMWPH